MTVDTYGHLLNETRALLATSRAIQENGFSTTTPS